MSDGDEELQRFSMLVDYKDLAMVTSHDIVSFEPGVNAYLATCFDGRRIVVPYHAVVRIEVVPDV